MQNKLGLFLCGLIILSLCGCVAHIFRPPTPPPPADNADHSIFGIHFGNHAPAQDSQKQNKSPAPPSPIKSAVDNLTDWIYGLASLAIIAGGLLAYFGGQLWLGLKIIAYSIGAIIASVYFREHYQAIIFWGLVSGLIYEFATHASWRAFVRKEISVAVSAVEEKLSQKKT